MSGQPTTLVAPDGQRFDVPAAGVAELKAKGFRELNEAEQHDVGLQEKYGTGVLPPIAAAAAGAASTLTFGGTDVLANAIGGPVAEANRELAERQPTAHTVGSAAAIALPIAGALAGASTAGKVAKGASSLITGVGKGSQALGDGAAALAKGAGFEGMAPLVGAGVQGAAEGAAFQLGHNLGDASRRDAQLDAETLLAHVGESAYLGAGISAAIPAAGKVVRWSADKAVAGLEQGMQGLRELGFTGAQAGLDAAESAAGAIARNADNIGEAVASTAGGAAGIFEKGAGAVVRNADNIGAAAENAGQKIGQLSDEHLLPRIRTSLTEQTGRPDIINEVFAGGPEARALRKQLGTETITGTREVHAEKLGESLNTIWKQTLDNEPMFDDLALALKKEAQSAELAGSAMSGKTQLELAKSIATEAGKTYERLGKYSNDAAKIFKESIDDFIERSMIKPSPEAIYMGLDKLKGATDRIAQWAKGAIGDMSIGAGAAAEAARDFRGFAKKLLEDEGVWGAAGAVQQEGNALYSKYRRAMEQFESQFAAAKAKGVRPRVLDGTKIKKYAKDITGQPGEVRNAVIDDLIEAQSNLIAFTDKLAKRVNAQGVGMTPAVAGTVRASSIAPDVVAESLGRGKAAADTLAATKATATKEIDRAEVLQAKQSSILSRQGAGVNPLPVDMMRQLGGGALIGGVVGGAPGAIVGGGITAVLQKYGAVTTNPKSAIELLNTIDRLRGVDKERVATWIRSLLGEAPEAGLRGKVADLAAKVDAKKIGAAVRGRAQAAEQALGRYPASSIETRQALPSARGALDNANRSTARKLLSARESAHRGIASIAENFGAAEPGILRRVLPASSYAGITESDPHEWWKRTQKAITDAQANPQAVADKLARDTDSISGALPDQARAIADQSMRVLGYLADRMPRNPRPYVLGQGEWTPSKTELKTYRDLVVVATKPDMLLPLLSTGTATKAQVEAVRSLWPAKFAEMKSQIVNAVMTAASEGRPVPYKSRIRLGQLLGVPLDPSQEPGFAAWMQAGAPPAVQQQSEAAGGSFRSGFTVNAGNELPLSARAATNRK